MYRNQPDDNIENKSIDVSLAKEMYFLAERNAKNRNKITWTKKFYIKRYLKLIKRRAKKSFIDVTITIDHFFNSTMKQDAEFAYFLSNELNKRGFETKLNGNVVHVKWDFSEKENNER